LLQRLLALIKLDNSLVVIEHAESRHIIRLEGEIERLTKERDYYRDLVIDLSTPEPVSEEGMQSLNTRKKSRQDVVSELEHRLAQREKSKDEKDSAA